MSRYPATSGVRIDEPAASRPRVFDCRANGDVLFAEEIREFLSVWGCRGHGTRRLQGAGAMESFAVHMR
jgi:hypothetical protein